jgi:signal transduction histidine kinase/DNA-binding response OmpR family regulator
MTETPRQEASAALAADKLAAPPANILLVDDRPANLLALEAILGDLAQNLIKAPSGAEALRALLRDDFALILLDVQMPDMDGLETAALIRARDRSRQTPIIFLTAHDKTELQVFKGYSLGAVDYLVKPIVPEVLRSKVAVFVELFQKTEQVKRQAELLRANERREHDRVLAAERHRWEVEHLRAEAEREKQLREELRQQAEALRQTVADRTRAEDKVREQARRQALVAQLGQRALAGLDLDTLLDQAVKVGVDVLGVEYCVVLELLPEGDQLLLRAGVGWNEGVTGRATVGLGTQSQAGYALLADEPVIVEDAETETRFEQAPVLHEHAVVGGVTVIIRGRERPFGVLGAHSSQRRGFAPEDVHFLQGIANVLGTAIQRGRHEDEIQEASRRKDEFLAMLAHELRNPLAPILNVVHLLRHVEMKGPGFDQAHKVLDRQVRHLTRLVDDLLDVSRITRGKIDLRKERVELRALVDRVVESLHPLVEARELRLSVTFPPEPIHFEADPTRLEQILANLLNNAVKYTEPGGSIWLNAAWEHDEVKVAVKDTGIGISKELLPHVFDLFMQADQSLDRAQGGLGIGLTLVRRLVELHGGRVEVSSPGPGQGSEFSVRLPAPAEPAGTPQAAPAAPGASKPARPLRLLIVEDNHDAAESLALVLDRAGHEVALADDGTQALERANQFRPEAVLLDIGLPGIDGYEVARQFRQCEELKQVPLIAMTGYGQAEDRRRSNEAGFDAHLVKPVDPDVLEGILARFTPAQAALDGKAFRSGTGA